MPGVGKMEGMIVQVISRVQACRMSGLSRPDHGRVKQKSRPGGLTS